ncbi:MAG: metal ABC transporter substrate-binding protein [Deltaproteobacteria bacterium]
MQERAKTFNIQKPRCASRFKAIVPLLLLVLLLGGCSRQAAVPSHNESEKPGEKVIVASFYPVYILTRNVCEGVPGIKVVNMTRPQTGCLHDYQLSPEDIKTLEEASYFVVNGGGAEAFMDKVIHQQPDLKIIEAARGIKLIKGSGNQGDNPHVWVSPSLYIKEIENVSEQLAQADPPNADQYRSNGQAYITKVKVLRDEMHQELDGLKDRNIVTFHEAFPYFAQEFDLKIVAVIEREPGSAPSAAELAKTITIVKRSGTRALFAEPQYLASAARSIADETGARVYSLDPGVTGPDQPDAYIKIMTQNLRTLKEALK